MFYLYKTESKFILITFSDYLSCFGLFQDRNAPKGLMMRDKLLNDLVSIADEMAIELSGNPRQRLTKAEKDKLLKTWNIMRQSIGAKPSDGDRPMGEAYNSNSERERSGNVVYLNTGSD